VEATEIELKRYFTQAVNAGDAKSAAAFQQQLDNMAAESTPDRTVMESVGGAVRGAAEYAVQGVKGVQDAIEGGRVGELAHSAAAGVVSGTEGLIDFPWAVAQMGSDFVDSDLDFMDIAPSEFLDPLTGGIYKEGAQRVTPKGESAANDLFFTGGEWGIPMSAPNKALKAVDAAGDVVRRVTSEAKNPSILRKGTDLIGRGVRKVNPDVVVGTMAGLGTLFDDPESSLYEMLGGFGTSVYQIASAIRNKRKLDKTSVRTLEQALESIGGNASAEGKALEQLLTNAKAKVGAGEQGTLAALTDDAGMFNLENRAVSDPHTTDAIREADRGYNQDTIERINERGGVTGDEFSDVMRPEFEKRLAGLDAEEATALLANKNELTREISEYERGIARLEDALRKAGTDVKDRTLMTNQLEQGRAALQFKRDALSELIYPKGSPSKADASSALVELTGKAEKLGKAPVDTLWEAYRANQDIPTSVLAKANKKFKDNVSPEKIKLVEKAYNEPLKFLKDATKKGKISPDSLATYISMVKKQTSNLAQQGKSFSEVDAIMAKHSKQVEESLKARGVTGKDYENAVSASKEFFDTFRNPTLQSKIKKAGDKSAEVLDGILTGSSGATLRKNLEELVKGAPEADEVVQQAIAADALGNYKGVFKQELLDTHSEILRRYPELEKNLKTLGTTDDAITAVDKGIKSANRELKAADKAEGQALGKLEKERVRALPQSAARRKAAADTKAAEAKEKGATALNKTKLAQAVNSPNDTINKILSVDNDFGVRETKDFIAEISKVDGAKDKFKRNFVNQLMAKNTGKSMAGDVVNRKMLDSLSNPNTQKTLIDSGLFTRSEVDALEEILDRTFLGERRKGGKATNLLSAKMSAWRNFAASALGSETARQSPVGSALVLTGVLKRIALGQMNFKGKETKESIALVNKLMADPSLLFSDNLLKEATSEAEVMNALNRISEGKRRLVKATAIANNDEQGDN